MNTGASREKFAQLRDARRVWAVGAIHGEARRLARVHDLIGERFFRGDRLVYCAGAIAELYRELGGDVIFYGKPHRPIYERAIELAAERRNQPTPLSRVLAIGDSVRTDLAGAHGFGIDCLFLTRGIHAGDLEGIDQLDPASVKGLFGHPPLALMRELKW